SGKSCLYFHSDLLVYQSLEALMFRKHKGKFAAGSRGRTPGEQTPPGSQKKKGKAWKKVLLGVLLVLLALIVAIIIFVVTSLNKINRVDPNAETLSKEEWEQ